MEAIAKGIMTYAFADPVRALVFIILVLCTFVIMQFLKNIDARFDNFKGELRSYAREMASLEKAISDKSVNLLSVINVLDQDLKKVRGDLNLNTQTTADFKVNLNNQMNKISSDVERFNNGVRKLMEIEKNIHSSNGRIIHLEDEQKSIAEVLRVIKDRLKK